MAFSGFYENITQNAGQSFAQQTHTLSTDFVYTIDNGTITNMIPRNTWEGIQMNLYRQRVTVRQPPIPQFLPPSHLLSTPPSRAVPFNTISTPPRQVLSTPTAPPPVRAINPLTWFNSSDRRDFINTMPEEDQREFDDMPDLIADEPIPHGITLSQFSHNTTTYTYHPSEEETEPEECSICKATYENDNIVTKLNNCDHKFHINCIETWASSNNNCPLCRTNIVTA
jgi:hypothetical protein